MFRKLWVSYKLITRKNSYLNTTGFIWSHQKIEPVDADDQPIPWMNYAMTELLDERLTKELTMFEYGAGYSTLYFAARVASVHSVEYDRAWEDRVTELLQPVENATLLFEEVGTDYINCAVNQPLKFDVILVDGRERVECTKASIAALSPAGVIILDDSDRNEYQAAFPLMHEAGFKNLRISGLKPFSFKREESTIFYRNANCLGI